MTSSALGLQAREAVWSNCKRTQSSGMRYFSVKEMLCSLRSKNRVEGKRLGRRLTETITGKFFLCKKYLRGGRCCVGRKMIGGPE